MNSKDYLLMSDPLQLTLKLLLRLSFSQTCSLEMTADSESVIAATLANGGVCPITGERIVSPESVKNVLSLMLSCGLYNYSGDFAFKVGLPAKSGVAGALVLVVPNVMGVTLWSPPLDEMGNSVRGVQFCEEFVKLYNFHDDTNSSNSLIKNSYETASSTIINLLMAASVGDETALKCAFQQDVDMNQGDYDGRTALHLAAAEGHFRCVRFLLEECKVKHDCKDRWGQTPLTEAIQFKHTKVASLIKRHERAVSIKPGSWNKLSMSSDTADDKDKGGERLWRKFVEKNWIKRDKEKPVYKFDPANLEGLEDPDAEKRRAKEQDQLEELKVSLKDQLERKRYPSAGDHHHLHVGGNLPTIPSSNSMNSDDEAKAAKIIQKKFRSIMNKKKSTRKQPNKKTAEGKKKL